MLIKPGKLTAVVTFRSFGDNPAVPQSIWFSNDDHFHLNGHVNKWNMHVWDSEHLRNGAVWLRYTLLSSIVGPTFFDDTMTAVISMASKKN
jgi:hypothetical protein